MAVKGKHLTQSRRSVVAARKVRLGDVCTLSKGVQVNGAELSDGCEFPFLNGGINPSGRWKSYNVEGDTVTISEGGNSCGYVNYINCRFWCGAHCYYLFNLRGNAKYLYYALKSQETRIMGLRTGVCMPNIKKSVISNFEFLYHESLSEQKRIVAKLDKICELKKNVEARLEKLDTLVKSRFVEMFGDLVANDKRWTFAPLGKVCDVRDGTHASPQYFSAGYPLMTSKNFTGGYEDFSDVKFISKEDFDEINKRSRVDVGDVVMPMIGTIGNPVIITSDREFAIKNVSLIKFIDGSPINVFVKAVLSSQYFQRVVDEKNRGNTQKFIALSDIRGVRIPLPPIALQREFAAFVAKVDKLKAATRKSLDLVDTLYRQQLQEAFG